MYALKNQSEEKAKNMLPLECAISLYNPQKQHQKKEWRLAICEEKESGPSIQDISRNIREIIFSSKGCGKSRKDKEFDHIIFKIIRLLNASEKIKSLLDADEKSTKLSPTTLKSKQSKFVLV